MKFLVVDDRSSARHVLVRLLSAVEGSTAVEADSLARGRAEVLAHSFDLAFVDVRLSDDPIDRDGLTLLQEIKERTATPVVMVTGSDDMATVRAAIRAGAWDYVLKDDLCEEVVLKIVDDVRQRRSLEREVLHSRARAGAGAALNDLVGASKPMERLRAVIQRVAVSDRPALVLGPSGSGKELVARALHSLGPRPSAEFLDLNCGALPAALTESLLFGHEKGSFTGALARSEGYLAAVQDGTLFLDELAEMPLELQVKLLRVLETKKFRPVGPGREQEFRGRLIAATNADLEERVRQGKFREDLFHRLDVLRLRVPSLEERREDVPALVAHFASRQPRPMRFHEDAIRALGLMSWPGNVRQLRNVVERLAVFCDDDPISAASLREHLEGIDASPPDDDLLFRVARLVLSSGAENKLEAVEHALIDEAMRQAKGNKSQAARLLGVHRKVIERRTSDPAPRPDGA